MARAAPTLADFRALQTQLLTLKQELSEERERNAQFPVPPNPAVPRAPVHQIRAAAWRAFQQRDRALLRLVLHCWRAAQVQSTILRNMSNLILRQRAATPATNAADECHRLGAPHVAISCLRFEVEECEKETHSQALRAAELCAALCQQLDDGDARAEVEREISASEMGTLETARNDAYLAWHEQHQTAERGRMALAAVVDALSAAHTCAVRAIEPPR